jgi:predicted regulator of Ras-like GTPase activity (Roadblock/LC7/MglB family)
MDVERVMQGQVAVQEPEQEEISISALLNDLLRYEEVLGLLVVSVEGLAMGSAGLDESDAEFVSVLGAQLVGVAERTTRRLGAGSALSISIHAYDGLLTVRNGGSFALLVLSEACETRRLCEVTDPVMLQLGALLNRV